MSGIRAIQTVGQDGLLEGLDKHSDEHQCAAPDNKEQRTGHGVHLGTGVCSTDERLQKVGGNHGLG
eukprot:13621053-Heterocapsa_arctica.AAC.1